MRTIESPGVEINEKDISFNTQLPNGTTSLVVGFTKQGPTNELVNVTSIEELEQIYGLPETSAERYAYMTARKVLQANGNMLFTRLPYGSGNGDSASEEYSALVYPFIPVDTSLQSYAASAVGATHIFNIAEAGISGQTLTTSDVSIVEETNTIFNTISSRFTVTSPFSAGVAELTMTFNASGSVYDLSTDYPSQPALSGIKIYGIVNSVTGTDNEYTTNTLFNVVLSANTVLPSAADIDVNVTYNNISSTSVDANDATHYFIGEPIHITLSETVYQDWLQGGIAWQNALTPSASGVIAGDVDSVGYGAMIVVNTAKTAITEQFEGFYVAIADNTKMDKGSNFDSIASVKSFDINNTSEAWQAVNQSSLSFNLTGSYFEKSGSISEIVESIPDFDFSNNGVGGFGDSVAMALFKIRPSLYNEDSRTLDRVLFETHLGSFDSTRTIQNKNGGAPLDFYLENVINNASDNLKVFINPYISKNNIQWIDPVTQEPVKFVRVSCGARDVLGSNSSDVIGTTLAEPHADAAAIYNYLNTAMYAGDVNNADNLYGVGEARLADPTEGKWIGNLPIKLEKALRLAENKEELRVDLVPEAGLGTVWAGMVLNDNNYNDISTTVRKSEVFDDTVKVTGILEANDRFDADSDGLASQTNGSSSEASDLYETVANVFIQFCQNTRKDCLYIADPLRYIFVQGDGAMKIMDNKALNFSQHIFWPLKNLFGGINTSFACTYANWLKVNDPATGKFIWTPPSGFISNLMVKTDTNFFPWYATAGLTRGILDDVVDIGVNPSQKHRDLIYKIGINPVVYWPGDGYVVWGQKTLQKKPSAFDRINVRRLFLWAEKAVLPLSRYFVFEQNTPFTRKRLVDALDPILAYAKSNEGVYDYMIVCDDRNNTSDTIDRNELIVDIYIKPTRVAEYILINFVATRTGQDFNEIV